MGQKFRLNWTRDEWQRKIRRSGSWLENVAQSLHAFDLLAQRGKSVKEVAKIVGVGEATVKTRMFYARRKLASLVRAGCDTRLTS